MPENFSTILEDIADEGRARMRPFPAASIHTLGRARKRQRLAVATSGVVACGVAVGIVLGGGTASSSAPITPAHTPSPSAARPWNPTPTTVDTSRLLQAAELPEANRFQWKLDQAFPGWRNTSLDNAICGSTESGAPTRDTHADSSDRAQYISPYSGENAFETVLHYPSEAAALQDYAMLSLDTTKCVSAIVGKKTAGMDGGFAWTQHDHDGNNGMHFLVARNGSDIAVFEYMGAYDVAADPTVLQRLADRLAGRPVTPVTMTPLPGALPDSVWLTPAEIPYAKSDKSENGWVSVQRPQGGPDDALPTDICDALVGGGKEVMGDMLHGTPHDVPEDPVTNSLYASAFQSIHTYTDAAGAMAAFEHAKQLASVSSCTHRDPSSGKQVTSAVKIGTVTAAGFTVSVDGGHWHNRSFVVVKGDHIAELGVGFEVPGDNPLTDQAVLAEMASRLP